MIFWASSSTSSSRSIADVTYVPGTKAAGDTVQYACYVGSQLKFIGTVEFAKAKPVELTMISSTNGVKFTVADFFKNPALVDANAIIRYFNFRYISSRFMHSKNYFPIILSAAKPVLNCIFENGLN